MMRNEGMTRRREAMRRQGSHQYRGYGDSDSWSPFLRHRCSSSDVMLPGLREAAAALCRAADRETLTAVIELLRQSDPRGQAANGPGQAANSRPAAAAPAVPEAAAPEAAAPDGVHPYGCGAVPATAAAAAVPHLHRSASDGGELIRRGAAHHAAAASSAAPAASPPEAARSPAQTAAAIAGRAAALLGGTLGTLGTPTLAALARFSTPPRAAAAARPAADGPEQTPQALFAHRLLKSRSTPALSSAAEATLHSTSSASMLRELAHAPATVKLGLDLGGTLTKLVIATPVDPTSPRDPLDLSKAAGDGGDGGDGEAATTLRSHDRLTLRVDVDGVPMTLQFVSSSTHALERSLSFLVDDKAAAAAADAPAGTAPASPGGGKTRRRIVAAGGGAHKLRASFRTALGIELTPFREMQSIVDGLLLLNELGVHDELYEVVVDAAGVASEVPAVWPDELLPLLLVNVGSGVSCLVVSREGYSRVGGTACGGATFLGLARALTSARTFESALELAAQGSSHRVDTLVEDIYGSAGCADLNLPPSMTAASFGKLHREEEGRPAPSEADVARALLEMVAQSCCVLARAHAAQLGCRRRIFFAGGFVDENPLARQTIAKSLRSLGGKAHFLRHSDFLGALGATAHALDQAVPKRRIDMLPEAPAAARPDGDDHAGDQFRYEPYRSTSRVPPTRRRTAPEAETSVEHDIRAGAAADPIFQRPAPAEAPDRRAAP